MPFNTLLSTCLLSGTHFTESGKTVSLQRQSHETVLFFSIDDQSNPACALRRNLNLTGPICDLLIFRAAFTRDGTLRSTALCLVELKGGDVRKALKQVENTYRFLCRSLPQSLRSNLVWKAYVLLYGGSPRNCKRARQRLEREGVQVGIRRTGNIGDFLRRE